MQFKKIDSLNGFNFYKFNLPIVFPLNEYYTLTLHGFIKKIQTFKGIF